MCRMLSMEPRGTSQVLPLSSMDNIAQTQSPPWMLLQGGEAGQGALIPRVRPSAFTFYSDCPQPEMHASFQSLGSSQELTRFLI